MKVYTSQLSESHRRQLEVESAISIEVIQESGIRTVTRGGELPKGFSRRQRRRGAGMLFPVPRPNGETAYCFRPDQSDPENPGRKYEQPSKHCGGPGNVLGIYTTGSRDQIWDASVPVAFTEGVKKALSIISAARAAGIELVVVAISGVWNWISDGVPIPDMLAIPVEGRRVTILFDSDMLRNPNVQEAARRLAEHLLSRGAGVWITYLRDKPDGSKVGADDHFASGGSFSELRMLTRRYNPADFERVRLSRDEKLRSAVRSLECQFWLEEWKGQGGHSDRDVYLRLIESAKRSGEHVADGIRVVKAQGQLAIEAKISTRTLWKALNRLEKRGLIYRDNEGRKPDKAGAFILSANVSQYEKGKVKEGKDTQGLQGVYRSDLHLRAPRLRWSRPKFTPKRGTVRDTRKVREAPKPEPRDRIERLGKIRGAILDVLDAAGGTATLQKIADVLHRKRPRDIRRRNLPMLQEAGILTVDGDTVTLCDNWLDRLNDARMLGQELEADEVARKRYRNKSRAYHIRNAVEPTHHYTNLGADGYIEDLSPIESEPEPEEVPPPPELSDLAQAIRNYLDRSPSDACQPPGWIGVTLWAYDLYDGKPAPAEVRQAVEELGGEAYLRSRLRAADEEVAA